MPVSVGHAKNVTVADWSGTVTVANSTGGTTTAAASNLARPSDWNSAHNVTMPPCSFFQPFPLHNTNSTVSAPGIGTWYLQPFDLPYDLSSGRINVFVTNAAGFLNGNVFSGNTSTGSASHVQTLYNNLALYQLGTGASTTRLESKWTGAMEMRFTRSLQMSTSVATSSLRATNYITASFPAQWDISGGVTYSTTSQSGSTSTAVTTTWASTVVNNLITGVVAYLSGSRMDVIPVASNIPAGAYWLAHNFWSTSASAGTRYTALTMMSTHNRLGLLEHNVQGYKRLGLSVSDSTSTPIAMHGYFATTSTAAPANIATSDVRGTTGRMYWNYLRSD